MSRIAERTTRHRVMGQWTTTTALLLLLALVAGLIAHARASERSHRATAERALRDYAAFAAWGFNRALTSLVHEGAGATLARARRLRLAADGPLPAASLLYPDSTSCGCGFQPDVWVSWRVDLASGDVSVHGRMSDDARRSLADRLPSLAQSAAREGVGRRDSMPNAFSTWARVVVDTLAGKTQAIVYTVVRDYDQVPRAAYGVVALPRFLTNAFRCVSDKNRLLPPSLIGPLPNDSVLHLRVARADGTVFYSTAEGKTTGFDATDRLPSHLGGLAVTVALRPEIASSLLIGGLPPSRLPMLLGLLGAAVLLAVVALVQLRRSRELARLRSEFVANVSHELRTPLAQISMFSETLYLGRERSSDERQHFLSVIFREARRLTTLVESVLRYSRGEAHANRVRLERRDIAQDVRETVQSFEPLAMAADVALAVDCADEAEAMADPGALRQIVLNLLDNAVKYGPREQTVTVRVTRSVNDILVSVSDEGPGIPRADRERVFEPFARLDRPDLPRVSGTGIGLAVVRELVLAHHGRVWVEPARDASPEGARVCLTIPAVARLRHSIARLDQASSHDAVATLAR
jgi:signal transduction histidine kinase